MFLTIVNSTFNTAKCIGATLQSIDAVSKN